MDGKNYLRLFEASRCMSRQEIKQYLNGELSGTQLRRVESHISGCQLCADALDGYADFNSPTLELPGFVPPSDLTGTASVQTNRRHPLTRRLTVAAILLPGLFFLFKWLSPSNNEDLFRQYYASYPNDIPLSARSAQSANQLHPQLLLALEQYETGDFSAALPGLQLVLREDDDNHAANFFAGICCLELADYQQAIPYLEKCRQSDTLYASRATWYLALALLKNDQVAASKSLLTELSENSGGYRRKDAQELLERL